MRAACSSARGAEASARYSETSCQQRCRRAPAQRSPPLSSPASAAALRSPARLRRDRVAPGAARCRRFLAPVAAVKQKRAPPSSLSAAEGEGGSEGPPWGLVAVGTALAGGIALAAVNHDAVYSRLEAFAAGLADNPHALAEFWVAYVTCEMLGVPALPLTMSAGALFGVAKGTALVSTAGVAAAGGGFLVARYALRERITRMLDGNAKWSAINRALGANSFRIITLLRLSPLMPFSLSNYAYGITRLELAPYLAGSWLGMLPGTLAYVSAGSVGGAVAAHGLSGVDGTLGAGLVGGAALAIASAGYIAKLVNEAVQADEADEAAALKDKKR